MIRQDASGGAPNIDAVAVTAVGQPASFFAPVIVSPAAFEMAENGTEVGEVDATDADGVTLSYAITGGADAALFTLDVATGALAFAAAPDFEAPSDADGDNVYEVEITATDGVDAVSQTLQVTVTDTNEAPTAIALDGASLPEDAAPGAVVGQLSAVDPDAGDVVGFTVADERFVVEDGALKVAPGAVFDFAAEPTITLAVTATDLAGATYVQNFVISVVDVDAPVAAVTLAPFAVDENAPGVPVADIAIDDPDTVYAPGDVTLSGEGAGLYRVVSDGTGLQLALADGVSLDFEAPPAAVIVTVGGVASAPFVPEIADLNEAPRDITLDGGAVAEGAPAGSVVGQLAATDPDTPATW